jgi:hypothetical protein
MADQQQPNQLNIEISEEVAEGSYANLAIITHSHAEFVIDFVFLHQQSCNILLHLLIICDPVLYIKVV